MDDNETEVPDKIRKLGITRIRSNIDGKSIHVPPVIIFHFFLDSLIELVEKHDKPIDR